MRAHVQPHGPLRYVYWRVKMPESSEENALTTLQLDVSAETGLKFEFYRCGGDNITPLKESWLTRGKVEEGKRAELILGRGTPESAAVAVRIDGPGENLLYREARTLEAEVIELTGFSLAESWKENYRYRIRPKGKVTGDLPVFVERVEVRVDGEKVKSETP